MQTQRKTRSGLVGLIGAGVLALLVQPSYAQGTWTGAGLRNQAVLNDRSLSAEQKADIVAANYADTFAAQHRLAKERDNSSESTSANNSPHYEPLSVYSLEARAKFQADKEVRGYIRKFKETGDKAKARAYGQVMSYLAGAQYDLDYGVGKTYSLEDKAKLMISTSERLRQNNLSDELIKEMVAFTGAQYDKRFEVDTRSESSGVRVNEKPAQEQEPTHNFTGLAPGGYSSERQLVTFEDHTMPAYYSGSATTNN